MTQKQQTQPAQAKPAPDMAGFSLSSLFMAPEDDPTRVNSERCIEVVQGERSHRPVSSLAGGRMVPDSLLKCAISESTKVTGADATELLPFIESLVEQGEILPRLTVTTGHGGSLGLPRIVTPPETASPVEQGIGIPASSGAIADPAAFTVEVDALALVRLQASAIIDPEARITAGPAAFDTALQTEAARRLGDHLENQLWAGAGTVGQVEGLESLITDAGADSNVHNFVPGAVLSSDSWGMVKMMNDGKIPRMGRFWVASEAMSQNFLGLVYEPRREIHQLPIIDSTRPAQDGIAPNETGRLFLISGPSVRVAFYGSETELSVYQNPKSGVREFGFLRLVSVFFPHGGKKAFRVLKVA